MLITQEHTFQYGGQSVVIKQGTLGEGLGARIWAVSFCSSSTEAAMA